MIWLITLLQVVDIATTVYLLNKAGYAEGNPAIKWLMGRIGKLPALVGAKLLVVAAILVFHNEVQHWGLVVVAAYYAFVCGNNAYHVYKASQRL